MVSSSLRMMIRILSVFLLVVTFMAFSPLLQQEAQAGWWGSSSRAKQKDQPIVVTGVSPVGPKSFTIEANRTFTGKETKDYSALRLPNPYRLVLDIPNARLQAPQAVYIIQRNGIERVELSENSSPFYQAVRATVFVDNRNVLDQLSTAFQGSTLRVEAHATDTTANNVIKNGAEFSKQVVSGRYGGLPPVIRPEVAPNRQSDGGFARANTISTTQSILNAPVPAGAALIKDIYFKDNRLYIRAAEDADLRIQDRFTLSKPTRLVLDIGNAVLADRSLLSPLSGDMRDIRQVRVGQFDERTVRLVLETPNPSAFDAVYTGSDRSLLSIVPYSATTATRLSSNTPLGQIDNIDLKRSGDKVVLRITASTPIVHRFVKKDDRVVLEFLNQAARSTPIGFNAQAYPEIEAMRLEPLTAGEPNARMVVTLANKYVEVSPRFSDNGRSLEIDITRDAAREIANNDMLNNIASLENSAGKAPFAARIVVDAGHGGKDNGAMRRGGVNEKDLNLSLALMVRDALAAKGFTVYMTRSTDEFLPLPKITAITNRIQPDLFISIHHNASVNPALNGIETYYYTPQSRLLAQKVHDREISSVGARNGGVKKAMFYVIHHTAVPAILCEVGYVSNASELSDLQSARRKLSTARSIADGVVDYLRTTMAASAR